jgi:hypothetical protein
MDGWNIRGGKWEEPEKRNEDNEEERKSGNRERVRRKKIQVREKVESLKSPGLLLTGLLLRVAILSKNIFENSKKFAKKSKQKISKK